jgi:hypothetical protein
VKWQGKTITSSAVCHGGRPSMTSLREVTASPLYDLCIRPNQSNPVFLVTSCNSPVNIRKKGPDPEQIATKGFFGFKSFIGSQTTPEKKSPKIGPREILNFW